ncbi:hypothetical protein N7492_005859 [Penicillium capsulatum]|uniref:Pheromone-regulated membrane protein n=1 Tax=Penicillium capsulatum TaxID=69766 RepID=A0A9W9ID78_9EURO|nr:hypothetical protein N7492_005859 [Penicillium capsulatum]KAJ6135039.1 hypothetical protein N7512_000199 [Penicillium capsulatum]
MGCNGDREKGDVGIEEKWDYVNLDDFKSESCWTPFSYFFLWVFLIVSISVYGVDIFTAVNLLAFSRWAGRVQPAIPFKISRWIFAICILVSFALLVYRWLLALRAMRSGSITRSYLDPLAVRIQSFRVFGSKGRGWKRFLVFAELTKSKKGAEYIALYTYFSFQFWMNTIFADGPRQVINAITLYSVMQMDLLPGGENAAEDDGRSPFLQFFSNIKILADDSNLQAVVLFGMLFTLIIWVLSVLKLISACILYLIFLFHHIPAEDGTLKAYCRRKIRSRLTRLVRRKVNKALSKGVKLQNRAPTQPSLASSDSKPTLPSVDGDKGPIVTTLSRSTTETTLPPYTRSNSATTDKQPTLPTALFDKPPLTRTTTQSSAMSDSASLTGNAAPMGYSPLDRQNSPLPPVPPLPATVPPRMGPTPSRPTPGPSPFANDRRRGAPAAIPGYGNMMDSSAQSHRTYTPASGPYAHGTQSATAEDDYFTQPPRHYDPYASQSPYGPNDDYEPWYETSMSYQNPPRAEPYSSQGAYRSHTPASTGATPRPRGEIPRTREMAPAAYRGTPAGQAGHQQSRPQQRSCTPMTPQSPAGSQGGRGYTAFNPAAGSQQQPPLPGPAPPTGYQSFTRANTASPSTMGRNAPEGYRFNRANTDQF